MKKLLILGAGQMQVPVIQRAKEFGVETYVVDMSAGAPGLKYADHYEVIDTNDKEHVLEYARKCNIDGLLTTSDYPVNVVAFVSNELNLAGKLSPEVAALCTNKFKEREFLHSHGFKCPKYRLVSTLKEAKQTDYFPCMVKPVDSSASRGVMKVHNMEELVREFPISLDYSRSGKVIIEEFIGGKEFSVETLTQNNKTEVIQITEKLCIGEEKGYFVEDTHIEPARIPESTANDIRKTVTEILTAMGFNNCPSHTELKVADDGIYIIEIACRLGGDYITSDLVPLSTGVSMLDNLIRLSLGEPIDTTRTKNDYSMVQFLNPSNYDRCVEFARKNKESIFRSEIHPYHNVEIKSSLDRLGYIILSRPTKEEIEEVLNIIK